MSTPASLSLKIIGGDGREYGPTDLATAQQWAREGRIAGQTQVWDARDGRWQPAAQVAELAEFLGTTSQLSASGSAKTAAAPRMNTLAVSSLALAAIGSGCCGCGCLSVPAVVLGAVSVWQIRARGEAGMGLAVAAIALGTFSIMAGLLCGALWTFFRMRL